MIWRKRLLADEWGLLNTTLLCTGNQVKGLEKRKTQTDNDNGNPKNKIKRQMQNFYQINLLLDYTVNLLSSSLNTITCYKVLFSYKALLYF